MDPAHARGQGLEPVTCDDLEVDVLGEPLEQPCAHELHATSTRIDGVRDVRDAKPLGHVPGNGRCSPGRRHEIGGGGGGIAAISARARANDMSR